MENLTDPFPEGDLSRIPEGSPNGTDEKANIEIDLCNNLKPCDPVGKNLQRVNFNDDEDEDFLGFPPANPRNPTRRGRLRTLRTGLRDRPRKVRTSENFLVEANDDVAMLTEIPLKRALNSPESSEWMSAMAEEVKSILSKCTWDLVERTVASEVIGSCFVLRNKFGTNGELE